jgi:hypothetical protein
MVEFERFKVGISIQKLHQKTQFFNPRPQAFGFNGSTHPHCGAMESLQKIPSKNKKIRRKYTIAI